MSGQYILQNVSLSEGRFGRTWRRVKGFSWTDSLISASELLSFCVLEKFLKQACCDECRTDGQFRVVWDLPVWPSSSWTLYTLTANLSAFTSQGSSSPSCSFFPSHLISVYVSLSLLLCSPPVPPPYYPQSHSFHSSLFAQSVSYTPQVQELFF